jgi:hypothetical protein
MATKDHNNHLVVSFLTLRKSIGILGVALPFALMTGTIAAGACSEILGSVSEYYHTITRNIFVGFLSALSLFFFCYKGYDRSDNIAAKLASLFALGIAFFPTNIDTAFPPCTFAPLRNENIIGSIHLFSAASFFLVLSYFSLFLFTKTDQASPTPEKKKRNKVYKVCGWIMLSCLLILFVYFVFVPDHIYKSLQAFKPVFFLETICLIAFGTSWLTKGEALLSDKLEVKRENALVEM